MPFLIIIAIFFSLIIIAQINKKNKISKENKIKIVKLANKANQYISRADKAKTINGKINNLERALELLEQAKLYPEHRKLIKDYYKLVNKIELVKKVLPVDNYLEKAKKYNFKGNNTAEKNSLLDALYEIKKKNITNKDFDITETYDEDTGELITIELIEDRLIELGWDGKRDISTL